MSWITIVFWVLTHLKDIFDIVKQIIDLIKGAPFAKQEEVRNKLSEAIEQYKKDGSKEGFKKTCEGLVGCPSQLVK